MCHVWYLSLPTAIQLSNESLLKYFSVRPLVRLALNRDRLVPAPLVIDEFFVFGFARIKLSEFVALVVGCDIKSR